MPEVWNYIDGEVMANGCTGCSWTWNKWKWKINEKFLWGRKALEWTFLKTQNVRILVLWEFFPNSNYYKGGSLWITGLDSPSVGVNHCLCHLPEACPISLWASDNTGRFGGHAWARQHGLSHKGNDFCWVLNPSTAEGNINLSDSAAFIWMVIGPPGLVHWTPIMEWEGMYGTSLESSLIQNVNFHSLPAILLSLPPPMGF